MLPKMIKYKINFVINTEIMAINEDKAKRIFLRGYYGGIIFITTIR